MAPNLHRRKQQQYCPAEDRNRSAFGLKTRVAASTPTFSAPSESSESYWDWPTPATIETTEEASPVVPLRDVLFSASYLEAQLVSQAESFSSSAPRSLNPSHDAYWIDPTPTIVCDDNDENHDDNINVDDDCVRPVAAESCSVPQNDRSNHHGDDEYWVWNPEHDRNQASDAYWLWKATVDPCGWKDDKKDNISSRNIDDYWQWKHDGTRTTFSDDYWQWNATVPCA